MTMKQQGSKLQSLVELKLKNIKLDLFGGERNVEHLDGYERNAEHYEEGKRMKKAILLLIICLVAGSLLLASCTKTPSTTTTIPVTTSSTPTAKPSATTPAVQAPKYGGTLTLAINTDIQGWDHAKYPAGFLNQLAFIYDGLVMNDWAKGVKDRLCD